MRNDSRREPIGRNASTCREVHNYGVRARYREATADRAAQRRARRSKVCKLAANVLLAEIVEDKLERRWSPQQISGWLARRFPDRPELQVSHETIDLSLYNQARRALRRELTDLHAISAERLDDIAADFNERPRQTLDFPSPSEALTAALR